MTTHRMIWNQTAYFGTGCVKVLPEELSRRGHKKAFVVSDAVLVSTGVTGKVTSLLDEIGFPYEIFSDVAPNPPVENVKAGVEAFKKAGADVLIAVGGGSPQDTCKAIGIIITNPEFEDVLSLEGYTPTKHPAVPIIAIPTTAGTASETTINYVITATEQHRKFLAADPHDIPVMAIVDPEMMASAPVSLKVATGLDALTHAIEGYITPDAWELSDLFHLKAMRLIAKSLPKAAAGDSEAMENMALAQYIAGMGYSNVGLGLVHGMAHALGGVYNTPHGVANGVLLAPILAFNAEATGEKYRDVADAFGVEEAYSMPIDEARAAAVKAIVDFVVELGNPTTLTEIGGHEEDLGRLADAAIVDVCTGTNPRKVTRDEIKELYRSIL